MRYLKIFALSLALSASANAGSIDAIYAFGDSLSDAGNAFIATGGAIPGAPYVNGQFTNGPIWLQTLATGLGLSPLTPSLAGGTDFAVGSAESGNTLFHTAGPADLPNQLNSFELTHTVADPNALFVIWLGANDLEAIPASATSLQIGTDLAAIAGNIDAGIGTLAGLGAKNFLVVTVPDLGKTPLALSQGPVAAAGISAVAASLDSTLVQGSVPAGIPSLATIASVDGLNLKVLDTYSLLDALIANPAPFGFTNVTGQCVTGAVNFVGGTACSNNPAIQNQFLFWDQQHPTAAGHALIGDAALAVLTPEPASLSLLAAGLLGLAMIRRSRLR